MAIKRFLGRWRSATPIALRSYAVEADRETASKIVGLRRALDIRLRPRGFRPHIGLLPLSYIADDVRPVATNGLESGRFQGFL